MAQKTEVPEEVKAAAVAAAGKKTGVVATPDVQTAFEATAAANRVEFGSVAHERILSPAYGGLSRVTAAQIIKEREADPHLWPWEKYQQAKKFLAVLNTKPGVTAKEPHWKREEV